MSRTKFALLRACACGSWRLQVVGTLKLSEGWWIFCEECGQMHTQEAPLRRDAVPSYSVQRHRSGGS